MVQYRLPQKLFVLKKSQILCHSPLPRIQGAGASGASTVDIFYCVSFLTPRLIFIYIVSRDGCKTCGGFVDLATVVHTTAGENNSYLLAAILS